MRACGCSRASHVVFSGSPKSEGHGAPKGATFGVSLSGNNMRKLSTKSASPFGAPLRFFCLRDRSSGCGIQWSFAPSFIPADFSAVHPTACSHRRQSHVVGSVGDPQPPGRMAANDARRHRILVRIQDASRSAPHEQDDRNIIKIREMSRAKLVLGQGIAIVAAESNEA